MIVRINQLEEAEYDDTKKKIIRRMRTQKLNTGHMKVMENKPSVLIVDVDQIEENYVYSSGAVAQDFKLYFSESS